MDGHHIQLAHRQTGVRVRGVMTAFQGLRFLSGVREPDCRNEDLRGRPGGV